MLSSHYYDLFFCCYYLGIDNSPAEISNWHLIFLHCCFSCFYFLLFLFSYILLVDSNSPKQQWLCKPEREVEKFCKKIFEKICYEIYQWNKYFVLMKEKVVSKSRLFCLSVETCIQVAKLTYHWSRWYASYIITHSFNFSHFFHMWRITNKIKMTRIRSSQDKLFLKELKPQQFRKLRDCFYIL